MFLNYHNIADNYQPNNLIKAFPYTIKESKLDPIAASKPYEDYNAKGELTGYFWRFGETLNLEFNIDGEITIEDDALVLKVKGQVPTESTMGKVNQKAYNIVDLRSWKCISTSGVRYTWVEDSEFEYPLSGGRTIYLSSEDYLKDKNVEVTLYNFRLEPITSKVFPGAPTIIFSIDRELSQQLVKGIYYCSVKVFNANTCLTIFDSNDCNLVVK